jgi:hypothetical protein
MPPAANRTLIAVLLAAAVLVVGGLGVLGAAFWFGVKPLLDRATEVARADPPPPPKADPPAKVTPEPTPPPAEPEPPPVAPPPADGSARDRAFRARSADEFIDRSEKLKGKWVVVPARVEKVRGDTPQPIVELVHTRRQHTSATFKKENWPAAPIGVDDEVEVVGQVSAANETFAMLYDCTLLGHTPAPPPTPLPVTAAEVIAAFDADPEAAAARFRSRTVRIIGMVRGWRGQKGVRTGLTVTGDQLGKHAIEVEFVPDQLAAVQTFPTLTPLTVIGRFPGRPLSYANRVLLEHARFDPPRTGPVVVVPKADPFVLSDQAKRTIAERHVRENGGVIDYREEGKTRTAYGVRYFSNVRDQELAHVAAFKELERIFVSGTNVTDGVIPSLKGLTELRALTLQCDKVGDAGLKHLAGFPKLERLDLSGTGVTDAGMKDVARVPMLRELNLHRTGIGDAGLKELEAAKGLTQLVVTTTRVTDAGVRSFRAAVPGCKVER